MTVVDYIIVFVLGFLVSFMLTPAVIKLARKIGVVDKPNARKVHTESKPRLGGLSIYGGFIFAAFYSAIFVGVSLPWSIVIGATIIVITGFLDDKFELSPIVKLTGQLVAALVVLLNGIQIKVITIPFIAGDIQISWIVAFVVSLVWIIGITNAVNLIDGLDGLASGVSIIAFSAIFTMALIIGNTMVALLALAVMGSTLAFLYFNFHPSKIFMGDTGSLLLGYLLAVGSLIGLKQVTFVTLIIPIIILGVPITDTLIAIIRRKLNNQAIMAPDKNHLHHRLLAVGFTHRKAVLFIYAIATYFAISAISFYKANLLGSSIIFLALLIVIQLLIEKLSLINNSYRPLLTLIRKIRVFFGSIPQRRT
ncbi:glycosyltransferase family 4 protein [Sutcliffiella deserti]|uniref:glycosyltransferase family 4 protein n=1 Tax=Sutcliffiella deserti TaxID=2875501 RepID=UPI001CBBD386|nr:MraY family glycosyltransferase [Sutcliffiella deserti]